MGELTRLEARRAIRRHWIEYILNSDCAHDCAPLERELWADECQKIATRIELRARSGEQFQSPTEDME